MSALLSDMKLINPDIGCLGIPSHSRAASQQRFLSLLTGEGPEKLLGAARGIWSKLLPLPAALPACTRQALFETHPGFSFHFFSSCGLRQMFSHHTDSVLSFGGEMSAEEGTHTHINTCTHVCTHMWVWRSGGLCLRHYLPSFF